MGKKGKKDKGGDDAEAAEAAPAEEGADPKEGKEKKGKGKKGKGKDEEASAEGGEPAEPADDKKGKKGKDKKGKKSKEGGEADEAKEGEGEAGGEDEEGKGKKGKGKKGKEKAAAEGGEEAPPEDGKKKGKGKKGKAETVKDEEVEKKKTDKTKSQVTLVDDRKSKSQMSMTSLKTKPSKSKSLFSVEDMQRAMSRSYSMFFDSDSSGSSKESLEDKKGKSKVKFEGEDEGKGKKKKAKEEGEEGAEGKEEAKPAKKPKGKKGKKEKPPPPEVYDPIVELARLKESLGIVTEPVVEAAAAGEGKKKKGKGEAPAKKLSKKDKAMKEAEMLFQAKKAAELEIKQILAAEVKRQEMEKKAMILKQKRDSAEQTRRIEQLSYWESLKEAMTSYHWQISKDEIDECEWQQYLKCDGLPDPKSPQEMNTYLHLWEKVIEDTTVDEAKNRTTQIIKLLRDIDDYIDDPFDAPERLHSNWKWVRSLGREHQLENLDMTTYRLLRDIDNRLNRLDIPTADYTIKEKDFVLCMYVLVRLATPMENPRAPASKRLEIDFPALQMNVYFPVSIEAKCMAIRAMYLTYDHLTDTCASYYPPPYPPEYHRDLISTVSEEWYIKIKYKFDNRIRPKTMIEDEEGNLVEGPPEPDPEFEEGELRPIVPYQKLEPSASQIFLEIDDERYKNAREHALLEVEEDVVNLRRYLIIGGVFCLELFYQPPQPIPTVSFEVLITALQLPKRLSDVPCHIDFSPPVDDPLVKKLPADLEEEIRQQEEDMDRLMLITLTLPEHVIFLDLPMVCHWDAERKVWKTADVFDLKHIEEKGYLTFRTGQFGYFSFAVNRYLNFPFQTWEIKPELNGTVTFQLTCAILMLEFNIKSNRICMTQLQNSPNKALQEHIGIYYKLPKLKRILLTGGVDIFPSYDALEFVEASCEKHWPMEEHLYYNIGMLSVIYNFSWSRWNSQAGRRSIVTQMRQYHLERARQTNFSMVLVTPLKANFIDCSEVSPAYNDTPAEGAKFSPDLFHLMKGSSSVSTRNKVLDGPKDVAATLAGLLIETRIFSFS